MLKSALLLAWAGNQGVITSNPQKGGGMMTKRVIKAYSGLGTNFKIGIIISIIAIFLTSSVLIASTGSGITFSGHTPANGSIVTAANPKVSVYVQDMTDNLDAGSLVVKLNSNPIAADMQFKGYIDSCTDSWVVQSYKEGTISFSTSGLANGIYTVEISIADIYGNIAVEAWSFEVKTEVKFSNHTPQLNSFIGTTRPKISVQARDGAIDKNKIQVFLDGVDVTSEISVTEISNGCTIAYTPQDNLVEGKQYTVLVKVFDTYKGIYESTTWKFTVEALPRPSEWTPTKGSTIAITNPVVSLYIADRLEELDDRSVSARLNGQTVNAVFEYTTMYDACGGYLGINKKEGTVRFNASGLAQGLNTVEISISDKAGNVLNETWSFTVDSLPQSSQWTPAKNSTVSTSAPAISLYVAAKAADLNPQSIIAKLNGEPVAASLQYKGYTDACTDTWIIQSYKEGTVRINPSGLQDGTNTVEIGIADKAGNTVNETWSFTVAEKPVISSLYPGNGSENVGVTRVSAVINDNGAVNWDDVRLFVNNNEVAFNYNEQTGELAYEYEFPTGTHQIKLEAVDMNGNQSSAAWSFVSSSTAPELTDLQYFSGGMTITNGVLKFNARLNDSVDIKDNVTLKLNGTPLDIDFRFKGYTDTCTDQYIIVSRKEAYVSYEKKVVDGENLALELYAENKYGFNRKWTWTFNVLAVPTISNVTPMKYGVTEFQPAISAVVSDNDHIESIVMKLNGVDVAYQYDPNTGKLTYIPAEPLPNETNYTVSVTAVDGIGLTTDKTWKFTVNTYPDMYDGNVTSCQACHENQSNRPPYEAIHPEFLFQGHESSCDNCHIYITIPDVCSGCHYPGQVLPEPFPPHNEYPDTKYSPKGYSATEPLRVTTNREEWDCIICHQPGAGTKTGPTWGNNRLLNNHDIPQLHVAPLTPDSESCTECHARSLTREHARDGRVDEEGNAINCNTCHKSTEPLIQGAITAKDLSCAACHESADHESLHVTGIDSYCGECHIGSLTSEHMNNEVTTGSSDYGCETCHVNSKKEVVRAIETNRRNCTTCHTQGHNVYFADDVPEDILLHESFNWTTVMEAEIFAGEPGVPAEYLGGQVVMSDRRSDLTPENVRNLYNDFLTTNSWESAAYTLMADNRGFAEEYKKGSRAVLIYFYNTSGRTGEGNPVPAGYRLEIWYR